MANEAALEFLVKKITGLEIVQHELTRLYTITVDLDQADAIRQRVTSLNELLFALRSARNSIEASNSVVTPPEASRVQALEQALHQLDAYVRSDDHIHMALNYLSQVASMLNQA